jgi:hypothetical protein
MVNYEEDSADNLKRPNRTNENHISAQSIDYDGLAEHTDVANGARQQEKHADTLQSNVKESSLNTHHQAMNSIESDDIFPPVMIPGDKQEAVFKMNVELLKEYKEKHGHTNVKHRDSETLANWRKHLRNSFSKKQRGLKPHTKLTDEKCSC